jgi:hypothetical protein
MAQGHNIVKRDEKRPRGPRQRRSAVEIWGDTPSSERHYWAAAEDHIRSHFESADLMLDDHETVAAMALNMRRQGRAAAKRSSS